MSPAGAPLTAIRLRRFGSGALLAARVQAALENAGLPRLAERFAAEALPLSGEALAELAGRYVRLERGVPRRPLWRRSRRWWLSRPAALRQAWWEKNRRHRRAYPAVVIAASLLQLFCRPATYLAEGSWRSVAAGLFLTVYLGGLALHVWACYGGFQRTCRRTDARIRWGTRLF